MPTSDDPLHRCYGVFSGEAGAGGYSKVLLAASRDSGVWHALKYLDRHKTQQEAAEREADILNSLDHPNIIKLLRLFPPHVPHRLQWVLAQPAADTDLAVFLSKRGGHIDRSLAQSFAKQLAEGLGYTHHKGVLHRDIKPANLLLTMCPSHIAGLPVLLQVADFGISRKRCEKRLTIIDKTTCDERHRPLMAAETMTAHVVTSWYRPPELLLLDEGVFRDGDVRYGCSLDVWSYGCVVYELLSGTVLCRASLIREMVARILAVLGPPPAEIWRDENFVQWEGRMPEPSVSLRPLAQNDIAWDVVRATLRWVPAERASLSALVAKSEWLGAPTAKAPPTAEVSAVGASLPLAEPRGKEDIFTGTPSTRPSPRTSTTTCAPKGVFTGMPSTRPRTRTSTTPCACKGHCCNPLHRHKQSCPCHELAKGTDRCLGCLCTVCLKHPRNDSDLCFADRAVVGNELSGSLTLARAARDLHQELLPCDVVDFLQQYPVICNLFPLVILVALIKEPMAIRLLMEALAESQGVVDPTKIDADAMAAALEKMLRGLDGVRNPAELHQLNRQGVGRFMGALSTCRLFHLIEAEDNDDEALAESQGEGEPEAALTLGLLRGQYRFTGDRTQIESLWKHTAAHTGFCMDLGSVDFPDDLLLLAHKVKGMLVTLGQEVTSLQTKSGGYVCHFVSRKIVLAHMAWRSHPRFDWESTPVSTLKECCPDQSSQLDTVPSRWSAAALSRCIFGRHDWGLLASMAGCLWKEPLDAWPRHQEAIFAAVRSKDFSRVVQEAKAQGCPYCPMVALQHLPAFQHLKQYGRQEKKAQPARKRQKN